MEAMLQRRGVTLRDTQLSLSEMLNPFDLHGIDKATRVLADTLKNRHTIALAGDYDVDGTTGVAVGMKALYSFGATKTIPLLPNRFVDGYGLQSSMVEQANELGVRTLVTVDNGINANQAINLAREKGMEVIITDHHLPSKELPNASAIINPNLPDCSFASKHLAGVGVIFYLMCALRTKLREAKWFLFNKLPEPNMGRLLDLVAIGTIADMASIDKNNRILIKSGLDKIRSGNAQKGVIALLEAMQVEPQHCTSHDLGFSIAPPLNAAGRLASMDIGLACLNATSWHQARTATAELIALNLQRKQIQTLMFQEAVKAAANQIEQQGNSNLIVLFDPDWHQGLTGIVAGMIKDKFDASCFVIAKAGDLLVGSGRAKHKDHLLNWLDRVNQMDNKLLNRYGGHAFAAGFTIEANAVARLRDLLQQTWQQPAPDATKQIDDDGELKPTQLTLKNAQLLEQLTPWGKGCEEPIFHAKLILVASQVIGSNHLRLQFAAPYDPDITIEGVGFYLSEDDLPKDRPVLLRVYFHLGVNRFRGSVKPQLVVNKCTPADNQDKDTISLSQKYGD